tara:strand:- start:18 stop:1289 length:1272 start_codon:yes stop_codon:yes gene_type:complete
MIKIFGDIILDVWIKGDYKRKSPEAPVYILDQKKIKTNLGGAGNVAANLKNLGNKIKLFGVIAKDTNGKKILNLLTKLKIKNNISNVATITTAKTRLINEKNKHLMRVDDEKIYTSDDSLKKLKDNNNSKDLIIICDYAKGLIKKDTIKKILQFNQNIFIDPKNSVYFYKGAFLIKPNMKQYEKWIGKFSIKKSIKLIKQMRWSWLVVTNGKNGVYVINKFGESKHYKEKVSNVADVSGAGDTFISVLCHSHNKGMNIFDASKLACYASARIVEKPTVQSVSYKDLNRKIVFTNGVFDILHPGHIKLLKFCKKISNKLIIGLNSDLSVKQIKGNDRPYNNIKIRIRNLTKLNLADEILVFNEKTPLNLISRIQPDVLVKGGDYKKKQIIGQKLSKVIIFPTLNGYSTTKILKKINEKNINYRS